MGLMFFRDAVLHGQCSMGQCFKGLMPFQGEGLLGVMP